MESAFESAELKKTLSEELEHFEENGEKERRVYVNHERTTVVESFFYEDEVITKEISYNQHGNRDGFTKKYVNGVLRMAMPHKKGWREGLSYTFTPEGELESETPYRRGEKHGVHKEYDKNGNLQIETPYVRGKKQGVKKWYDKNGRVAKRVRYENDKRDYTYKHKYCPYEDDSMI